MAQYIVAVDFDGTMVEHQYPDIGQPVPEAIEWVHKWIEAGAKIVLWTIRSHQGTGRLDQAVEYMENAGIELYGVNKNPTQKSFSSSAKAYAHKYVDDMAFGCPMVQPEGFDKPVVDWSVVGPAILKEVKEAKVLKPKKAKKKE